MVDYDFYTEEVKTAGNDKIVIGHTTKDDESVCLIMRENSIAIGYTRGERAYVGGSMDDNSMAIGYTTGKKAHVGSSLQNTPITIGCTTGEEASVANAVWGESIAIGSTEGRESKVGRGMICGLGGIAIGHTKGDIAHIGEKVHNSAIAMGYTEGVGSDIGWWVSSNSIAIGYAEEATVGGLMEDNSVAIGYTAERGGLLVGHSINDNALAIGFERGKFVLKNKSGKIEYDENKLTGELKSKLEILKTLDLTKFKTVGGREIDLKKWAEEIGKVKGKNPALAEIAEIAVNFRKSKQLSTNDQQLLPLDKNSLAVQILKLAYRIFQDAGVEVQNETMLALVK